MTTVSTLGTYGDSSGSPLVFRNKIINGGFDIWQRGTSQTSSGYGSDDRWSNDNVGSTKTTSQQPFTVGQTDVPGNPTYFSRTVVSSVANAANYVIKRHRIESVSTLSGQLATLSFWAKADATKNIAVEFRQNFGTGGSTEVDSLGITTVPLTSSWQRFTVTVSLPSISTKTVGTSNYLAIHFWFDAGSNYNARTNSLGQQSGTFDIANVQLEAGPVATPFEQRPIGMELALCQRYLPAVVATSGANANPWPAYTQSANIFRVVIPFKVSTRAPVTSVTISAASHFACSFNGGGQAVTAISFAGGGTESATLDFTVGSASLNLPGNGYSNNASAKLLFEGAEL